MIALPAAEVFRGRRSREKIAVVYVPMGQYPIIKAQKSGELREEEKCIHWILLRKTWQIVAICVVLELNVLYCFPCLRFFLIFVGSN